MCDIGVYGLAVMGQNFALNIASHGFSVAVCNRSIEKVHKTDQHLRLFNQIKRESNIYIVFIF